MATEVISDGQGSSDDSHLRHNRLFCKLVAKANFLTQEMLSECMQLVGDENSTTKIEQVMVQRNLLSPDMVTGIYLKQGILRCPSCQKRSKIPKKLPKRARCPHCKIVFNIPHAYPFLDLKVAPEIKDLCGTELGAYKVQYCLGAGGMGEVYRAIHIRLNRAVALKVLPPHLARQHQYIERFTREARMAAQVTDKHLVQMYDVGEDNGIHYIAMEFIDGAPLNQYVPKDKGIKLHRALQILKESAMGLGTLHDKEILHRDIKPDNILVTSDEIAKLTDFGLAKESGDSGEALTQTGVLIGTPYYMAPEQCLGKKATKQSDIYSLGMTFYFMLQGGLPFTGGNPLEIIGQRMNNPSPSLPKHIPAIVQNVYKKMIAERPRERYRNTQELIRDVNRLISKDIVIDSPAQQILSSKVKIGIITSIVSILLVLSIIGISRKMRQTKKPPTSSQKIVSLIENPEEKTKKPQKENKEENKEESKEENKKEEPPSQPKEISQKTEKKESPDKKGENIPEKPLIDHNLLFNQLKKELSTLPKLENKLTRLLEFRVQYPQTPYRTQVFHLIKKIQERIVLRRKTEKYLDEVAKNKMEILTQPNREKLRWEPPREIRLLLLSPDYKKKAMQLHQELVLLENIALSIQEGNYKKAEKTAKTLLPLLKKSEKKKLETFLKTKERSAQQKKQKEEIQNAWTGIQENVENYLGKRQYSQARKHIRKAKGSLKELSKYKGYQDLIEMIQGEEEIIFLLEKFWYHFRFNVFKTLGPGEQITPRTMSVLDIMKKVESMPNWPDKKVQVGWFYLFEGQVEKAQGVLGKHYLPSSSLAKLWERHYQSLK